jgi:hypothetical protein
LLTILRLHVVIPPIDPLNPQETALVLLSCLLIRQKFAGKVIPGRGVSPIQPFAS